MYVARILYPVRVLGPGDRIGIWFDGCPHHCNGCSNPELWEFKDEYKTNIQTVMNLIYSVADRNNIDGFTLTGGDPFYQPEALEMLLNEIYGISSDILCYTGFDYEQIKANYKEILGKVAVLIDGRYIEQQNNGSILRGSDNQRVIILKEEQKDRYDEYMRNASNEVQNFKTHNSMISVGIHKRDYNDNIKDFASRNGFVEVLQEKGGE